MITVSLADDHKLVREGIKVLLQSSGKFQIVSESNNGAELLQALETMESLPNLVIVDVSMPVMSGFDAVSNIRDKYPGLSCIALSLHDDFNTVFGMIDRGAKAYLLKDCSPEQMVNTALTVHYEGSCYNSFVVEKIMEYQKNSEKDTSKGLEDSFSEREIEFIKLCCSELTNKDIADRLNVSPRTVDGYRESVCLKAGVSSRIGIVLFAMDNGLYKPGDNKDLN
jgi:DNA-binding NarL/FixJ family response regulator